MKPLTETLDKVATIIDTYETGSWQSMDNLRVLLRELSICHYHITQVNIEAGREWNASVFRYKGSNAAAQAFASTEVPQLRQTRKLLVTISKVLDSMRSEISILKIES